MIKKKIKNPKQSWEATAPKNEKKVRHFNLNNYQTLKGKISLNPNTWVDYDYGVHPPNLTLKSKYHNSQETEETFSVGKFPVLKKIVSEIPKNMDAQEMDLYLIRDMEECFLWKNGSFEFSTNF